MSSLVLVACLSAIGTFLAMYLDGRLFDAKRTKATYIKNIVLVTTVATVAMYYFSQLPSLKPGVAAQLGGSTRFVDGEQILTGLPNF